MCRRFLEKSGVLGWERKKENGALSTHSLAPLESAHTKTTYTHTHTRNLLTKHEIAQMPASVSPGRLAGNTRKAGPQNPEEPHPPYNAMRHTTACLSRVCLWLGSLLW